MVQPIHKTSPILAQIKEDEKEEDPVKVKKVENDSKIEKITKEEDNAPKEVEIVK